MEIKGVDHALEEVTITLVSSHLFI